MVSPLFFIVYTSVYTTLIHIDLKPRICTGISKSTAVLGGLLARVIHTLNLPSKVVLKQNISRWLLKYRSKPLNALNAYSTLWVYVGCVHLCAHRRLCASLFNFKNLETKHL